MLTFPNCKINLGLYITGKRSDGYHNLETIFLPLNLEEALEIIHADNAGEPVQYSASGIRIDTDSNNNLCVKAYHLLKNDFPAIPPVKLHLHKSIPAGAGLGGGSADAAFTLKLINTKFNLGLSTEQLSSYALQLGSDCPFFIYNQPCFAKGRGEILEPVALSLTGYKFLIVNPGIPIHTGYAFSQIISAIPPVPVKDIIQQPVTGWKATLKNDFEGPVFKQYPAIKKIKDDLYTSGAVYASMSGSGSTVYGIFPADYKINNPFPQHYFVKEAMPL